jgi:hypothetical protein
MSAKIGVVRQKLLFYASLIEDQSMLFIYNLLVRLFNESNQISSWSREIEKQVSE